jgi:cytoskeleton protein RodZ
VSSQPDEAAGSDSIGARLRSGRERLGLSLIEAAERLHVEPRAIEALEAERFEEFGASVYARGHLRHYAELVGESALELQELYVTSAHAVRAPDLTQVASARRAEASPSALMPGMVVVAVVALVGSGWWIAGNLADSSSAEHAAGSVAAGAEPNDVLAPRTAAPGPAATSPVAAGIAALPAVATRTSSAITGSSPLKPVATASAQPAAAVDDAGAALQRRSAAAHPKVAQLQLHFSEDSWAEVYDAQGERLLFDVGSADSTRTVSGAPPLRVVLGNPVGVALALDGRPVSVPDGATRNVSIEFRINRSGRVAASRLAAAEARNEERKPGRD